MIDEYSNNVFTLVRQTDCMGMLYLSSALCVFNASARSNNDIFWLLIPKGVLSIPQLKSISCFEDLADTDSLKSLPMRVNALSSWHVCEN